MAAHQLAATERWLDWSIDVAGSAGLKWFANGLGSSFRCLSWCNGQRYGCSFGAMSVTAASLAKITRLILLSGTLRSLVVT